MAQECVKCGKEAKATVGGYEHYCEECLDGLICQYAGAIVDGSRDIEMAITLMVAVREHQRVHGG